MNSNDTSPSLIIMSETALLKYKHYIETLSKSILQLIKIMIVLCSCLTRGVTVPCDANDVFVNAHIKYDSLLDPCHLHVYK